MAGGLGSDVISGGADFDTLVFGQVSDNLQVILRLEYLPVLTLPLGIDTTAIEAVITGSGDDYIVGDDSANFLAGQDGADTISGGGSSDSIEGGLGADILWWSRVRYYRWWHR